MEQIDQKGGARSINSLKWSLLEFLEYLLLEVDSGFRPLEPSSILFGVPKVEVDSLPSGDWDRVPSSTKGEEHCCNLILDMNLIVRGRYDVRRGVVRV